MPTIKIIDDNGKITSSLLTGYSLEPLEEGFLLEINLPNNSIKYLIDTVRHNHNKYDIETFITNYFDNVLTNNKTANIEEYLHLGFINIGEGELRRQFTAQKK